MASNAFSPGCNDGVLNGTSEVTLVAAPSAGVIRMVRSGFIDNIDTVAHQVKVYVKRTGNTGYIFRPTLQVDDALNITKDDFIVLDSTRSLCAVMGDAVVTTAPTFYCSYADEV